MVCHCSNRTRIGPAPGERDLTTLRRCMSPVLDEATYVFCSFPDFCLPPEVDPICTFREREGLTAIVDKHQAQRHQLAYHFESRRITLTVHSSLDAVGFVAIVAGRLADAQIPCNVVSGYHHDHLFVPVLMVEDAMRVLEAVSTDASQSSLTRVQD